MFRQIAHSLEVIILFKVSRHTVGNKHMMVRVRSGVPRMIKVTLIAQRSTMMGPMLLILQAAWFPAQSCWGSVSFLK